MRNMKHNSHSENHILDSFFKVLSPGGFHELWWSNLSWQHPGIPWFSGLSLLPLKSTHCTFKPDSECILQPVSMLSSNSESHNATILSSSDNNNKLCILETCTFMLALLEILTRAWISSVFSKTNKHHSFPTDYFQPNKRFVEPQRIFHLFR